MIAVTPPAPAINPADRERVPSRRRGRPTALRRPLAVDEHFSSGGLSRTPVVGTQPPDVAAATRLEGVVDPVAVQPDARSVAPSDARAPRRGPVPLGLVDVDVG